MQITVSSKQGNIMFDDLDCGLGRIMMRNAPDRMHNLSGAFPWSKGKFFVHEVRAALLELTAVNYDHVFKFLEEMETTNDETT